MGYARAQLGDVTTPGGSGPGIVSQIASWFTGSVANADSSPQVVQDWQAGVRRRGNVAVRYPFPSDVVAQTGDLVERMDAGDSYNYIPAPMDVVNADRTMRGLERLAPITARVAEVAEGLGEGITGSLMKAALVVGGFVVLSNILTRRR